MLKMIPIVFLVCCAINWMHLVTFSGSVEENKLVNATRDRIDWIERTSIAPPGLMCAVQVSQLMKQADCLPAGSFSPNVAELVYNLKKNKWCEGEIPKKGGLAFTTRRGSKGRQHIASLLPVEEDVFFNLNFRAHVRELNHYYGCFSEFGRKLIELESANASSRSKVSLRTWFVRKGKMKVKACLETFPRYSSQMNHHLFAWLSKLKKELPGKVNRNAFSFVSKFVDQWHDIEEDFPMMVLARDELEKIKKQRFPHTRPIEEWRIHQSLRRKMTGENGQYFTIAHNVSMTFHLGPSDYKDLEWMQSLRFLWPPQECQN